MSDQMEKNIIKILKNQEEQNKFNKNVLEKLEKIENNQQLTNERLDNLENNQQVTIERLDNLENNQQVTIERLDNIENSQKETKSQLNNLELILNDTQETVVYNTSRIVNLETKLLDKIKGLYDAHSANGDKHKEFEDSIEHLNSKVFNLEVDNYAIKKDLKELKQA